MAMLIESGFDRVFSSQRIYRSMLDCLSRPGQHKRLAKVELNPPGGWPFALLAMAFTILDQQTTFAIYPEDLLLGDYIQANTGANPVDLELAEYVLCWGDGPVADLSALNRGTLLAPENSTTLLIAVRSLRDQLPEATKIILSGPGIYHKRNLTVSGLSIELLHCLKELNDEFPLGVDAFLADEGGRIAGLPRSVQIHCEVTES